MTKIKVPSLKKKAPSSASEKRVSNRARSEKRLAYMLVAPAVIVMLGVTAYPIAYAIYLSFFKADLRFPDNNEFIGLDNYRTIWESDIWWTSVETTLIITVISVILEFIVGMAVALFMYRAIVARGLVRSTMLIPYGIITVIAAISWQYAWTPNLGWITQLMGDTSAPLTERWPSISIIILAEVWKTFPFMALLLLTGLVLVPDELIEAAKVDGASAWQRFRRIILPIIKPAILVAVLFRTMDAFRIYDTIFLMTRGSNDTASVSITGYNTLFQSSNLGLGSALSVVIFIMTLIIAAVFIKGFGASAPGVERK